MEIRNYSIAKALKYPDWLLLVAVVLFVFLLQFKFPFYPLFNEGDQFIAAYNADRMLQGDRIYVDFFQFTFPGAQVLFAMLFSLFGLKLWVVNFVVVLIAVVTFWLCLRLSKMIVSGPYSYFPPIIFVFFGFRWYGLDASHRMISPIFIMLAVYALIKGTGPFRLVLAGAACALASFFTQQRGLVTVIALLFFLLLESYMRRDGLITFARKAGMLVSSFAVVLLVLCAYFIFTAGFDNFTQSTLFYPARYYRFHEENNYGVLLLDLQNVLAWNSVSSFFSIFPAVFYLLVVPLAPLAFFFVYYRDRQKHEWMYWRSGFLVTFLAVFNVVATTNPNSGRFFSLSVPSLILLSWLLSYFDVFGEARLKLTLSFASLIVAIGVLQAFRMQTNWPYTRFETPRGVAYALPGPRLQMYMWLRDHTTPNEYAYQVDDPFINFPLALRNPSRYGQIFPTDYTRPEHVDGVIEDLTKNPPRYIWWVTSYSKPNEARAPGDHLGPLCDYLRTNYSQISIPGVPPDSDAQIWESKRGTQP